MSSPKRKRQTCGYFAVTFWSAALLCRFWDTVTKKPARTRHREQAA